MKFRLQGRTQDEGVPDEGCRERYFGLREEVTGDWRTLHNEYLRDLYSTPNAIMGSHQGKRGGRGHVARVGEKRNAYRILVGKPEGP